MISNLPSQLRAAESQSEALMVGLSPRRPIYGMVVFEKLEKTADKGSCRWRRETLHIRGSWLWLGRWTRCLRRGAIVKAVDPQLATEDSSCFQVSLESCPTLRKTQTSSTHP